MNSIWVGELASNVSIGGSSLPLSSVSGTNWPSGSGVFGVQVGEDQDDDAELCQVTRSGSTLTLSASTLAKAHTAGVSIYYVATAEDINDKASLNAENIFAGVQYFNAGIYSQAADQFADITALKLRTTPSTTGYDWMTTFLGVTNTFASTNNRTSGNTNMSIDTDMATGGLTPSATTYAVNSSTGEVVAMTADIGGGYTYTIARGQLTGIGAAAAAAITAGDVWYVLPYGYYAWDHEAIIDGANDYDTFLLQGVGVWMPLEVKLADITTYNTSGRNFNFLINPDEWGLAPANVAYAGGAFTQDFTATSGYKSMYLTAAPGGADYIIVGAY